MTNIISNKNVTVMRNFLQSTSNRRFSFAQTKTDCLK